MGCFDEAASGTSGTMYVGVAAWNGTGTGMLTSSAVSVGGAPDGASPLQIGRTAKADNTGEFYFAGKIDEVRLSSTAVYTTTGYTPSKNPQVEATTSSITTALWKMNSTSGTTVLDEYNRSVSVPNGRNPGSLQTETSTNPTWVQGVSSNSKRKAKAARLASDAAPVAEAVLDALEGGKVAAPTTVSWSQDYSYDQYGNRQLMVSGSPDIIYRTAKNQIDTAAQPQYSYDANGNLLTDGGGVYSYDAENHMWRAQTSLGTTTYTYDGNGRRVKKQVVSGTTTTTRYVYGASGSLIAEYTMSVTTPSKEYVYGPVGLLATVESGAVRVVTPDHLGTPRIVTNGTGAVVSRHDYKPFGEEILAGAGIASGGRTGAGGMLYAAADNINQKFTGYERDVETGLDFAQARYFASLQGRFTSPDEPLLDQWEGNPQTWNLYIYGRNNPLAFIDPTGQKTYWYLGDQRIGDWDSVKIDNDAGTLTAQDGKVYNLTDLQAVEETVNDQGTIGPPPSQSELNYLDWAARTGQDDGTVADPTQAPISRWLFGETRVPYTDVSPDDIPYDVLPGGLGRVLKMEPGIPGGALTKISKFDRIANQAIKATGPKARKLLEKLVRMAGMKVVKGGGPEDKIVNSAGNYITSLPKSPKGEGTIRSIVDDIKKQGGQ